MDSSVLHRKLLFCGYNDVTDYLKNSPLNRYIYKQLLVLLPDHKIKSSILTIFNEVYYQCVKIQFDRKPGYEVAKRYLDEESRWLDSQLDAQLVFSIVIALEHQKCGQSFHDECFIEEMSQLLVLNKFTAITSNIETYIIQENIFIPYMFPTMTCSIKEIPDILPTRKKYRTFIDWIKYWFGIGMSTPDVKYENAWKTITDNYTESYIEDYLCLFLDPNDQEALLRSIQHNFLPDGYVKLDFEQLLHNIFLGSYYPKNNVVYDNLKSNTNFDSEEDYDQMFAAGLRQTEENAFNDKEEQYKQERDTLKHQLEELKKNYEADLERLEVKYQEEIAEIKKDLVKTAAKQTNAVHKNVSIPKGFSLSISEIADDAKTWFHESGASELTNMLYRFARKQQNMDEDLWKLIDSIVPAVEKRTAPNQTINIPTAQQVNINPKEVVNHTKEE